MILFNKFGYALRHEIKFDAKAKRGSLKLWSHYNGWYEGKDPIANGKNQLTEILVFEYARDGGNYRTEFPLGNVQDVFSLLAALIMLKNGKEYSFPNYQDRMISFSLSSEGKPPVVVIIVKIRYNSKAGKLILDEVHELETLTRNILLKLGYSNQEIVGKVAQMMGQSSTQSQ